MNEVLVQIKTILEELQEIKSQIEQFNAMAEDLKKQLNDAESVRYFDNWIPRKKLMDFLEYGDTQIAALFKQGDLLVSEIGIRKFIKKESVLKMLEKNLKK